MKTLRSTKYLQIGLILATLLGPTLLAQGQRAIVLGRVMDRTGAAIPNVEVKVIQTTTNVARTTQSNEEGYYEVPGLLPATFQVQAWHQGFKTAVVNDVLVTGGKRVEVNLVLELGEVKESVTVTSERQLLDSMSADVNTVVEQRKIAELPVGQGNASMFLLLAPGADQARGEGSGMDMQPLQRSLQGTTRFDGSPAGTTEYTLDGTPNTQIGNGPMGGAPAVNPSTEVVQEVRVQTATFDASIGHSGGATVDVVLKGGTNDFHGAGLGFFRSPSWQANSWAANVGGIPRPDFIYRRYGFNGGGPVWLGPLYKGKDKTFFYYGWEKWSSFSPNPPSVISVPSPEQLNGDFSKLLALGSKYQLYDPASAHLAANGRIERNPFLGNMIPASQIAPVAKAFAKLWPAANRTGTVDGQNNFSYNMSNLPRDMWTSTLRIDHNLSQNQKLFGRLVLSKTGIPYQSQFGSTEIANLSFTGLNRDFALGDVWTISPSFIADFRGALTRFRWDTRPVGLGMDYGNLGLGYLSSLLDTQRLGIPRVAIAGYGGAFGGSAGSRQVSEIRSAAAHFTKLAGSHSLKFGTDLRWYIDNRGAEDQLSVAFGSNYTIGPFDNSAPPPFGSALADFLLGKFASATIRKPAKPANLATSQAFYFQDDWKVTPRLTLNLGVRYEREGPATDRYNLALSGFAFDVANPIAAQVQANYAQNPIPELPVSQFRVMGGILFAGVGGNPRTIYDPDNNNFAPRIGLAYKLGKDTVIRAGYGIFFVPYGQRFLANAGSVPGFDVNTYSYATNDGGLTFNRTLGDLFPNGLDKPVGSSLGLATYLGQGASIPAPRNNANAYNQRWTFSIQRRFAGAHRLEVRYVGNHTVGMPISRDWGALPNSFLSNSPERDQAVIDDLTKLVSNPFYGVPGVSGSSGNSLVIAKNQLLRPFPQFASVVMPTRQGWTSYHGLQVEFERRLANGLTVQTNYTFAKTLDGLGYLNARDPIPQKVISDSDRTHIWRALSLYELPLGRGRAWGANVNRPLNYLIGGWQIQAIAVAESGVPLSWGNVIFRGNIKNIHVDGVSSQRMFNTDAGFEKNSKLQLAYNLRTFPSRLAGVRGSRDSNIDMSLIKNTVLKEHFNLQFRAEAYNMLNQHFFNAGYSISTNPASTTFGTAVDTSVQRTVQLGLRLVF